MARLEAEQDRLVCWLPVGIGLGIAAYFALPVEPPAILALLAVATALAAVRASNGRPAFFGAAFVLSVAIGFLCIVVRAHVVAAPVIPDSFGVAGVAGHVESVERLDDGSARLFVRPRLIDGLVEAETPRRLSLRARVSTEGVAAGQFVRFRAVLMPPPDATEPGGFDYARQAWFEGIGAVGFLTTSPEPADAAGPVPASLRVWASVERLRARIAARIADAIPGGTGGIASALVTGYRGGIPPDAQEALRASGLAHILAISGLHMMLVVGTVFWIVRAALAVFPRLALTHPIKKWAACAALAAGGGYLLISGGAVATQRAFVMASIMMLAVLLDRPAISMRNVSIAAMLVLAATPEALVSAGFQMSFAATVALVAAYESLRRGLAGEPATGLASGTWRYARSYVAALVMTAMVAGLATAPFAAFHFNRVAVYGLAGNVAAMPLVGTLVMPFGLIGMCLMPLGLERWPLAVMAAGIDGVLAVARTVAAWEGAVRTVPAFPVAALGAMTLGGLWLALWRGWWRWWGLGAILAGLAVIPAQHPPDLFVAREARMAALRGDDGALVFLPRASSRFVAERWLRAAGDGRAVDEGGLAGASCDSLACVAGSRRLSVALVTHPAAFGEECARADVVVTALAPPPWCAGEGALVIGPDEVRAGGATAVYVVASGLRVTTAAADAGVRPWNRRSGLNTAE